MQVLIVCADNAERQSLRDVLPADDYPAPSFADSGPDAFRLLETAEETEVDMLLADADDPAVGGVGLCRAVRAHDRWKDLPVLLLTGAGPERAFELAQAAGATDYVRRPVQAPELLARLRAAGGLKKVLDDCRKRKRELESLNRELQRLAVLDDLTGIANRRLFNLQLAQEWARAVREVVPLKKR